MILHLDNDGTLIFPSDAVYLEKNYGVNAKLPGINYDSITYMKSIEKVKKLQKKHNAKIMFPHDLEQFKKMKKAPEFYS